MDTASAKADLAEKYFKEGANCSQAVLAAFADELGITEEFAMRLASGFGGGMGRMREVCGAVSGMILVANILCGNGDKSDKKAKDAHYALIQKLAGKFREQNGSIICRELLGLEKTVRTSLFLKSVQSLITKSGPARNWSPSLPGSSKLNWGR